MRLASNTVVWGLSRRPLGWVPPVPSLFPAWLVVFERHHEQQADERDDEYDKTGECYQIHTPERGQVNAMLVDPFATPPEWVSPFVRLARFPGVVLLADNTARTDYTCSPARCAMARSSRPASAGIDLVSM